MESALKLAYFECLKFWSMTSNAAPCIKVVEYRNLCSTGLKNVATSIKLAPDFLKSMSKSGRPVTRALR